MNKDLKIKIAIDNQTKAIKFDDYWRDYAKLGLIVKQVIYVDQCIIKS